MSKAKTRKKGMNFIIFRVFGGKYWFRNWITEKRSIK